ncbi:hypothetical protein [Listeria booriae]|uniref:hypothetical protein n=1 Tax=Listeria booriae TaxID=1552123 RepID=UPI001E3BBCE2|nr:hypothetical protein [Listeria booriae]MCD2208574.1 hypothetical protein [Listeria booriae]
MNKHSQGIIRIKNNLSEILTPQDDSYQVFHEALKKGLIDIVPGDENMAYCTFQGSSKIENEVRTELYCPDEFFRDGLLELYGDIFIVNSNDSTNLTLNRDQLNYAKQVTYLQDPDYRQRARPDTSSFVYLCGNKVARDLEAADKEAQRSENQINSGKDSSELTIINIDINDYISKVYINDDQIFPEDRKDLIEEGVYNTDETYIGYIPNDALFHTSWSEEHGFHFAYIEGYNSLEEYEVRLKWKGLEDAVRTNYDGLNASELWDKYENMDRSKSYSR